MVLKKDLMVISCLRSNARETLTKISRKTKLPISTIYDRLKIQETDLITRHTSLLDFSKLGFNTRVSIAFKVSKECRSDFDDYLQIQPNVNSLYKINNGYDFLVEGIFRNLKELQEFMERIEDKFIIIDKQLYYVVDEIKREVFLSDLKSVETFFGSNGNKNIGANGNNIHQNKDRSLKL